MSSGPRRLLFVSGTAANVREGSGTYVGIAALRRALVQLGHEVKLIAPMRAIGLWRRLWFNLRLRGAVCGRDADACIGFDLDGLFLARGGVAAVKGVIAEERCYERGWARLSLGVQARWEGWRVRRARRVIATSDYAARAIERHYGVPAGDVRVVPELLDVAAWRALLAEAPVRTPSRAVVLCVAHLYRRKDVATLVRAAALLGQAAEIRIVGAGPEARSLRRLARQLGIEARVKFPGHVSRRQLAAEYRNASVFCLPSRQEGFGIVLLEAMAAGLPVVAARAAAIPEVVPEPCCGSLFEPGDAVALAAHLDALLADSEQRRQRGAAGRCHAARFDAATVAEQFLGALA